MYRTCSTVSIVDSEQTLFYCYANGDSHTIAAIDIFWFYDFLWFLLVIAWFRVQLRINLTSGNYEAWGMASSLRYHETNLSLTAGETMQLLVNFQFIAITIQPKSISLEQICYKRCQGIAVTSLDCLLFSTSKIKT